MQALVPESVLELAQELAPERPVPVQVQLGVAPVLVSELVPDVVLALA